MNFQEEKVKETKAQERTRVSKEYPIPLLVVDIDEQRRNLEA